MREVADGVWLVHQKELADVVGLTTRRIQQLTASGEIKRAKEGENGAKRNEYDLAKSVQAYISTVKEARGGSADGDPLREEQTLLTRTKRKIEETKLAIIRGEVHRSEDVEAVMNNMLMRFKGKLLAVPVRLAPKVIGIDNLPQLQDAIEDEILECLAELSEYDPQEFYEQSTHRIVLEGAEEDDDEDDG